MPTKRLKPAVMVPLLELKREEETTAHLRRTVAEQVAIRVTAQERVAKLERENARLALRKDAMEYALVLMQHQCRKHTDREAGLYTPGAEWAVAGPENVKAPRRDPGQEE